MDFSLAEGMTPPPSLCKVLVSVELVIRMPPSKSIHSPTYIISTGSHIHQHPHPQYGHAQTHGMSNDNISKSDPNPHPWHSNWFNGGYVGPEYSQNWYLDVESLFYCAHESFGLGLRNTIFLVTFGWPVWEINPMPEGNRAIYVLLEWVIYGWTPQLCW